MPKTSRDKFKEFNARMMIRYPNILKTVSNQLMCVLCNCNVNGSKTYNVYQHFETKKHKTAFHRNEEMQPNNINNVNEMPTTDIKRDYLEDFSQDLDSYDLELCGTLLEANITLDKIDDPALNTFLNKYTQHPTPSAKTLRNKYMPSIYENFISQLQMKAENKRIWIALSETIDAEANLLGNFVFGILDEEEKDEAYLFNIERLENANARALTTFFTDSLQLLWPNGIRYDDVLMILTDGSPHMLAVCRSLKILFPKMLHVTCIAKALDQLSDFMRSDFDLVNTFITNCKELFSKSAYRQHLMRNLHPNMPLPSCDSWLQAAAYYYEHFNQISKILERLNDEDSPTIPSTKLLIQNGKLKTDLKYVKTNFHCIFTSINQLKSETLELNGSLALLDNIKSTLLSVGRKKYIEKFDNVFKRNTGLRSLVKIRNKLYLNSNETVECIENLSTFDLNFFKFAPIICTEVEEKYSQYCKILANKNREELTFENVKQQLIIVCNSNLFQ